MWWYPPGVAPVTARVFLAHASEDKPRVRALHAALAARGFRPWLDELDLTPGLPYQPQIETAIRTCDAFVACLSHRAVAKSGYVQREFRMALNEYANRPPARVFLIPLRFDECEVPDLQIPALALRLRDIQWLDYWTPTAPDRLAAALCAAVPDAPLLPPPPPPPASADTDTDELRYEIGHRVAALGPLTADVFTFTQLHTAKGALAGRAELHPRLGKFGDFDPLFPQFENRSLFALLFELRKLVPPSARAALDGALAAAKELPRYTDSDTGRLVMLAPVGEEDSKWQVSRAHLGALRELLAALPAE